MPKVLDLFAGAGGFGLGFLLAGYDVYCSLEIDQWAADTLRENNKEKMIVIRDDIRNYKTKNQIIAACKKFPEIIIGGPPCQGFSVAGPAKKDTKDPRNSLFIDFARWVEFLEPKIFIMENVKPILTRKKENGVKVMDIISHTFSRLNYSLTIWKLNAAHYGIPQHRERVFIIGNYQNSTIEEPKPTHTYAPNGNKKSRSDLPRAITVREAINDLPKLSAGEGKEEQPYSEVPSSNYQIWARGDQDILFNHVSMNHTERIVDRFKRIKWGKSVTWVSDEFKANKRSGNGEKSNSTYSMNNRRFIPNKPAYTIPASFYSTFIHPYQHRNITSREAARLQSFPDWYRFMGKRTVVSQKLLERTGRQAEKGLSQYNQIGNAVPPLLAKAIAKKIIEYL